MMPADKSRTLFGGTEGWKADDWTSSDDSVRGGKSESHLDIEGGIAHFYGNLDIKTLGGAGFASQRTVADDLDFDLDDYAGIKLNFSKGDKKRYTFIVKDEVLQPDPDSGREQSSVSWECDFELPPQTEPGDTYSQTVYIPWESLTPTYRGKVQKDVAPLDRSAIKRVSLMMRSFFGTQEGDFSLYIRSITAESRAPPPNYGQSLGTSVDSGRLEDGPTEGIAEQPGAPDRSALNLQLNLGICKMELRMDYSALLIGVFVLLCWWMLA